MRGREALPRMITGEEALPRMISREEALPRMISREEALHRMISRGRIASPNETPGKGRCPECFPLAHVELPHGGQLVCIGSRLFRHYFVSQRRPPAALVTRIGNHLRAASSPLSLSSLLPLSLSSLLPLLHP